VSIQGVTSGWSGQLTNCPLVQKPYGEGSNDERRTRQAVQFELERTQASKSRVLEDLLISNLPKKDGPNYYALPGRTIKKG